MNVGVFGPRKGADLDQVRAFISWLHGSDPRAVVVSGGADGVDKTAEEEWLRLGGEVLSYRVRTVTPYEDYGIEEWHLGVAQPTVREVIEYPSAADYTGALWLRTFCAVEHIDRAVIFRSDNHYGDSGTKLTIDIATGNVPIYSLRKGDTEWQVS